MFYDKVNLTLSIIMLFLNGLTLGSFKSDAFKSEQMENHSFKTGMIQE